MSFGPSPAPPPAPSIVPSSDGPPSEVAPPTKAEPRGRPPRRPAPKKEKDVGGGTEAAKTEGTLPIHRVVRDSAEVASRSVAHKPEPSIASASAPSGAGISTWTCPTCKVEMPLADRGTHKKTHEGERAREPERAAAPAKTPDLARLEASVLEQVRGGLPRMLETGTERIYLVALVRHVLEEQGVPEDAMPADDVVRGFLAKLAPKSSVIKRALEVVA